MSKLVLPLHRNFSAEFYFFKKIESILVPLFWSHKWFVWPCLACWKHECMFPTRGHAAPLPSSPRPAPSLPLTSPQSPTRCRSLASSQTPAWPRCPNSLTLPTRGLVPGSTTAVTRLHIHWPIGVHVPRGFVCVGLLAPTWHAYFF